MTLADQFNAWADQLVDLSGRNDLISFRQTRTSTLALSAEAADSLLTGEWCPVRQLVNLGEKSSKDQLRKLIATSEENSDQLGIQTLRFISGFAEWNTDKISNPRAPFQLIEVQVRGSGTNLERCEFRLDREAASINPVLIQYFRSFAGLQLSDEAIEEALDESIETVQSLLQRALSPEWQLHFSPGLFLKNLTYQKLPMVEDLRRATEALSQHPVIASLAGDQAAINTLQQATVACSRSAPNTTPSREEFLILDADASQHWAINTALGGQNLVIEGPPGTGKSQTIANLIGAFLARGKSVLFVAEKRAAIEAVKKRIVRVGLGELLLDLHDAKALCSRPAAPFAEALNGLAEVPSVDLEPIHQVLDDAKKRLLDHSEALHRVRHPWGCSYYDVGSLLLETSAISKIPIRFSPAELEAMDQAALERAVGAVVELGGFPVEKVLDPDWVMAPAILNGGLAEGAAVADLLERSDGLVAPCQQLEAWLARIRPLLRQPEKFSLIEARQITEQLEALFQGLAAQVDLPGLMTLAPMERTELKRQLAKGTNQHLLARLIDRPHRRAIKQSQGLARSADLTAVVRANDLLLQLEERLIQVEHLPLGLSVRQEIEAIQKIGTHGRWLRSLGVAVPAESVPIAELLAVLQATAQERHLLRQAPPISQGLRAIEQAGGTRAGLTARIAECFVAGHTAQAVADNLRRSWAVQVEERLLLGDPLLQGATRTSLDGAVQRFCQSDRQTIVQTPSKIRRLVAERAHSLRLSPEGQQQERLIRGEALKRRRKGRLTARRLFEAAPELLTALKPCWAMSPLVVSQMLPADRQHFDVVIFDEASQIVPYEAVTAILRGRQVVVAGDSKQLSPTSTSFFNRRQEDDDLDPDQMDDASEYEVDAVKEAESLLEAMKSCLPPLSGTRMLQWHYRSEDERLIAFSNAHPDLYNGNLITLPGAAAQPPFRVHRVEGSQADLSGASPNAEVRRTVELAIEHLSQRPEQSLAVVAFGLKHALRIQKAFNIAMEQQGGELQMHPSDRPEEPFRIRNLETIQGDERDVVILATGYGLSKTGKPSYGFGPINNDENIQGLRRLNVAISRARKAVEIVTTINPDLYDANRLTKIGSKAFIDYIRFAGSGGNDLGDLKLERPPMNAFEQDIYAALQAEGLQLVPQHGVSGYRLDFAVQHPLRPGRFVLAIEADGAAYHSSDTARDRDRIRQEHLEKLGWRFHRIWSTEWMNNRRGEIEAAIQAYRLAIEENKYLDEGPTSAAVIVSSNSSSFVTTVGTKPVAAVSTRTPRPAIGQKPRIIDYSDGELQALVLWIQSDQVLRSDEDIITILMPELGFQRRGSRISERLTELIQACRNRGLMN